MLKILLLLLASGLATYGHSQQTNLKKLWVGRKNNYLLISDSLIRVEHEWRNFKNETNITGRYYKYAIVKDTLKIKEEYTKQAEPYDFIIQTLSGKELIIKAVDTLSSSMIDFTQPRSQPFQFRNRESITTDSIHFEKLLFHATQCYGICPVMTFRIDSSKQVQFIGERNAVKQGFYTAQLSKKLYQELLDILRISELDKLINTELAVVDAPAHAMEVHYNGKMKYVRATRFPIMGELLLKYLKELPEKLALQTSERPFEIDFSTPDATRDNW